MFLIHKAQKFQYQSNHLLNVMSKNLLLIAMYLTMWTLALIKKEKQGGLHCLLSYQMA